MKRVLATGCFVWFGVRLVAAYLPPVANWLLAAVFVSAFLVAMCIKPWKYVRVLSVIGLAAVLFQMMLYGLFVKPIQSLAGQTATATVIAEQVDTGFLENSVRGQFTVVSLNGVSLPKPKQFRVICSAFPEVSQGDVVQTTLLFQPLEEDAYYYGYLADGVLLQAEASSSIQNVGTSHALRFVMAELQHKLSITCRRYLPKTEGSILAAMAVGDSRYLTNETKANYRIAGITHLLVVSGQHLTLLCGLFAGRPGRRHARVRAAASIAMVLFVMALNGFSPSIARAGVAALIFYIGWFFYQPADGLTSLGVAAVLLTLSRCYAVCDLGLQLSFAATFGVLIADLTAKQWKRVRAQADKPISDGVYAVVMTLLITVFASAFTLPIQLLNNLPVSGVAIITNLLVMPLVGPVVILGLLAAFCGLIPGLLFAVRFFLLLAGFFIKLINQIVAFAIVLPGAQLMLPKGYTLFVVAILSVLIWLGCRWNCRRQAVVIVSGLAVMAMFLYSSLQKNVVTLITAGDAASPCVVVFYQEQSMVLFQGGESNRRSVMQTLQRYGVTEPNVWVDLRSDPTSLEIQAEKIIIAQQLQEKQAETISFCDIIGTIIHAESANVAVIQIEGYRVGVVQGTLMSASPLQLDVLIAGSKQPGTIEAQQIVAEKEYAWQKEYQAALFHYKPIGTSIQIRIGKAVQIGG